MKTHLNCQLCRPLFPHVFVFTYYYSTPALPCNWYAAYVVVLFTGQGCIGYTRGMISVGECHDAGEWDNSILDMDGHPLQLWGWGELKAAHRWRATRLLVKDGETIIGAAQVLTRTLPFPFKSLHYTPRGPVCTAEHREATYTALQEYAAKHLGGVVLTVEPDDEQAPSGAGWKAVANTILIPRTLILDLKKTEDELLADMTKKTRQYIRKSSRESGAVIQVTTREDIATCLGIYHQTAQRAHFALHDDQYYYDVNDKLGDSSVIFAAYDGDEIVAFVWLAVSGHTAFELYGGMNDRGQELRANYSLKWHAIQTCKRWGVTRYDMNGLLNDGVSTFKQGFASHENMLAGTYDYPLSPLYSLWTTALPKVRAVLRRIKTLR